MYVEKYFMDNYEGNTMFLCYKLLLNGKEIRNEKTERKRQRRTGSGKVIREESY